MIRKRSRKAGMLIGAIVVSVAGIVTGVVGATRAEASTPIYHGASACFWEKSVYICVNNKPAGGYDSSFSGRIDVAYTRRVEFQYHGTSWLGYLVFNDRGQSFLRNELYGDIFWVRVCTVDNSCSRWHQFPGD